MTDFLKFLWSLWTLINTLMEEFAHKVVGDMVGIKISAVNIYPQGRFCEVSRYTHHRLFPYTRGKVFSSVLNAFVLQNDLRLDGTTIVGVTFLTTGQPKPKVLDYLKFVAAGLVFRFMVTGVVLLIFSLVSPLSLLTILAAILWAVYVANALWMARGDDVAEILQYLKLYFGVPVKPVS